MRWCLVALAALWYAASVGIWVEADPDYPTFAAALQDQKNGLATFNIIATTPTLANATAFLNDPNNNAVLLAVTNNDVDAVIKEFNAGVAIADATAAKATFLFLTIPQPPGTQNAVLDLTDGVTLNTSLTNSPDFAAANTQTVTTLTFRDEGQGKWYVGGSPPAAQLDTSKTFTCGAGRMYILNGFPIPPSKTITTATSPAKLLSVEEALQPANIPANLSTYAELALADSTIKAMFQNSDLTITIFAPSNQAWSEYLASKRTTLAAFKGSKQAQDVLLGCMAVQRPYLVSQFPVGLTQVSDQLGRTYRMVSDGNASDSNPSAQLISNKMTRALSILPAPARNLRGGKSAIHGIDGVLIPEPAGANPPPLGPTPSVSPTPPAISAVGTLVAPADSSSNSSSKTNAGLIVGVVVGGTAAVALIALTVIYMKRRSTPSDQSWTIATGTSFVAKNTAGPHMELPGVHRGIFTRLVAHEFQWTEYKAIPGKTVCVEAGITDTQLDQMLVREGDVTGAREGQCPVVKLTKEEVKEQLVLLKDGIIGKGATAMVFQCLWPSRFGPDALLAIKVLKEGSDADPHHLQSFAYEASVLSSLLHPNVVRLYGYCLEPPTVVLILELLPTSLKRMLYDAEPCATRVSSPSGSGNAIAQKEEKLLTPPSTQIPGSAAQFTAHGNESSAHGSSQQQQTGLYSPSSAPSTSFLSGAQAQHSSNQDLKASPSTLTSDHADVAITVQDTKTAVRKLNIKEVLTISADVAAGLAFMHDRAGVEVQPASPFQEPSADRTAIAKVVHRDLKPANILVNSKGRAKISDFGLARQHHQTTIGTAHLGAGTLPYMAPELLVHATAGSYAHASATNRVDIYSLAMIIWEQLAGQPPWQGSADAALVIAVTQGRRPPLPEPPTEEPQLHPDLLVQPASLEVLPQLNAVVRACWRQRELKRPTATAVLFELNNLLTKLGVPPTDMAVSPDHVALSLFPAMSGAPSSAVEQLSSINVVP